MTPRRWTAALRPPATIATTVNLTNLFEVLCMLNAHDVLEAGELPASLSIDETCLKPKVQVAIGQLRVVIARVHLGSLSAKSLQWERSDDIGHFDILDVLVLLGQDVDVGVTSSLSALVIRHGAVVADRLAPIVLDGVLDDDCLFVH